MRNLQFADVTLRMTGVRPEGAPSFKEKIEIAKLLDRLAVPVIETPPITDAQVDALVVKTIANLAETAAVSVPVGLTEEAVSYTHLSPLLPHPSVGQGPSLCFFPLTG